MSVTPQGPTRWDVIIVPLWLVVFAIGLAPAPVFYLLRDWSLVVPQTAFVNTPAVITLGFAGYLGYFAFRSASEAGKSVSEAQSRAVQVVILALIAFLEIPARGGQLEVVTLLQMALRFREIPDSTLRMVVLFMGWIKLMAWWYLLSLVLRYHLVARRDVFARMPGFFFVPEPASETVEAPNSTPGSIEPPAQTENWRDESSHER